MNHRNGRRGNLDVDLNCEIAARAIPMKSEVRALAMTAIGYEF